MPKPNKPSLSDFQPQRKNANQHTPRGMGMLSESISNNGWFGAITCAADGEVIDGSARIETAFTKFEGIEPIVIESDGNIPIIVKRVDIPNAEDPTAKGVAIAANRVAEANLSWDTEILLQVGEEIDLSVYFYDNELELLQEKDEAIDLEDDDKPLSFSPADFGDKHALAIVLSEDEFEQWEEVKEALGLRKDTRAFLELIRYYLRGENG